MRQDIHRRRPGLALLVAALLVAATGGGAPAGPTDAPSERPATSPARPNILFLFSDDQRADAIGAYGNPHIDTPHLDRLSARGLDFRRAYCMGSIHGAVCQPSRAMLLSGRSLYRVPMDLDDVRILPEVLRDHGYTTFGTGKWHNGRASFARSFTHGEAVFIGGMSDHERVPVQDLAADGNFVNQRTASGFSTELFAQAAIDFLEGHDAAEPFFAYVSFTAPHDPRTPPGAYRARYDERKPPLPANALPQHPFDNGWMVGRDETLLPWPRPPDLLREQLAEYYGMISHLDAEVGRVLATLERTGHADDTIVVFASDHGLAIGSHGLLGKQNLYEHSTRTPLIIAGPGIPDGSSEALAYLFDLLPTLCAMIGVTPPEGVEGHDLTPILRGEADRVRSSLFTAYEDVQRAVRDDRYKLIRYPKIDKTQLFDLLDDPDERFDLAAEPGHGDRVSAMTRMLETWQRHTGDHAPLHVDAPEPAHIDLTGRERKPDRHQPDWVVDKYFGPR